MKRLATVCLYGLLGWGTLTGCRSVPAVIPPEAPRIELLGRVRWTPGHEGYDPELRGFHLSGDIGRIRIAAMDGPPQALNLVIRTSPGMPAKLEGFALSTAGASYSGASGLAELEIRRDGERESALVPQADYFRYTLVGGAIHVHFGPAALALLTQDCEVSWVDYYR